jgi:integrase
MMELTKEVLNECCESLPKYSYNCIERADKDNGLVIYKYMLAMKAEKDLSVNYRKAVIANLSRLSQFHKNKPFKSMVRQDVIAFLNKYRKSDADDPMHQWKGSYNSLLTYFVSFFKWLYYPDEIDRTKPDVIKNIGRQKRREQSIYTADDLWTTENDDLFLKYCSSKRLKCYHIVSRDTSARPHEICKLKIRDIQFRQNPDGTQYAESLVNGKTGTRYVPLINSIPYIKDYLDHEHPQPTNQEAAFIAGIKKGLGRHMSSANITRLYVEQSKRFSSLCNNPNVPPEDKHKIAELLKKRWNPYIRRHSALTEKAANQSINPILEQHAGWVEGSSMKKRYVHHFGKKANNGILEAYGILPSNSNNELKLRVKQCPQCNEPNTPDSRFCAKCRMVLRYDGYQESIEKQKENDNKVQALEAQIKELASAYNTFTQAVRLDIDKIGNLVQSGKYKRISEEEFKNVKVGGIGFVGKEVIEGKEFIRDRIFLAPTASNKPCNESA